MNQFSTLVTKRRSIREYNTEKKILSSEVRQIMKAALMSPTSKNSRPWQFVLVEDKEMLKKLAACKPSGATFIEKCPLVIIVLSDPTLSEAHIEDATIAATYIQLQVEDLKLGSCWVHIRKRKTANGYDSEQYVRDLLKIPLYLCVECIITVGHKFKEIKPQNEENLQWGKLHVGKW